ncbi:hypothetical protein HBI24_115040 [Parastagonospora nodorum]|nr:hypothetical protein HBI24_115040 [Parastagonospora nodorum]
MLPGVLQQLVACICIAKRCVVAICRSFSFCLILKFAMDHGITVARSTPSDSTPAGDWKRKNTLLSRLTEIYETKYWHPPALRAPVLVFTIAICWTLIAVLEYLLWKSQRDNGLIFAPVINDLPLGTTFVYLYFPTIVAVIFSIYWAWIDLETKRMEPYYQLSKPNGALGKDSLLLQYPFSFIPLAPIRAFRDKHWPVFWASFAVVLVTWGLVPTQAGLFSVQTVTRTTNATFAVSTYSMPVGKQEASLTFKYGQSTYGIATANESLPMYTARNFTLAPFKSADHERESLQKGTQTAPTTMYTLDLECENASHKADNSTRISYLSNGGCNITDLGLDGNLTVGENTSRYKSLETKQYTGMYIGYHNAGLASYYLSTLCPKSENTTFWAGFAKSKARAQDYPQDVTAIFCRARYWRQEVSATIDTMTSMPLKVVNLAERQPLDWSEFNATYFESVLNSGRLEVNARSDAMPGVTIPKYWDVVARTNLTLSSDLMSMVGLAVGTGTRPLEEYLDWQALSKAYADAYRLLFVRAMVDVLGKGDNFSSSKEVAGQRQVVSEAVLLEPVFVHIVVGFLAVVSISTIALLILTFIRQRNLRTDPSTIASIMSMVADNRALLSDFADLDCCSIEDVQKIIGNKRYKLTNNECGTEILEITPSAITYSETGFVSSTGQRRDSPSSIAKPVRPVEFSLWVAFPIINLFVALAILLGVLYGKAHANGLPLPSSNTVVQNILENYIPTAIATLIEPMWILINRLLCMLQPLEELQDCNAKAETSIDTNYSSLPPQLVVLQALRAKHFVLASVCAMALLANLLAVAFSGLFNQVSVDIQHTIALNPTYEPNFVLVNGSVGPLANNNQGTPNLSGAYFGGDGADHFLIAESNITRNTSLPAWTDNAMFYVPVFDEGGNTSHLSTSILEAKTNAIGATLECKEMELGQDFNAHIIDTEGSMNVSIPNGQGSVRCRNANNILVGPCKDEPSATEFVALLQARENATQAEEEICMTSVILGWMREGQGVCSAPGSVSIRPNNTLFVLCQPKLKRRTANIRVDAGGRLQAPAYYDSPSEVSPTNDTTNRSRTVDNNLVGHSNRFLFRAGAGWHNDTFANDYLNYFIKRTTNSSRLIDPELPVPKLEDVLEPLNQVYAKLFAIWFGRNKQDLLVPNQNNESATLYGSRLEPERRLFLSSTMFIISEAILCTYVVVAIWVYTRRPGQYLARMPTSIASIIALFAASTAVEDMQGTSHLDRKERAQHLRRLDSRYGFGSFIGGMDGRVHIGIEKVPLVVKPRAKKTTWLEHILPLLRKRSVGPSV